MTSYEHLTSLTRDELYDRLDLRPEEGPLIFGELSKRRRVRDARDFLLILAIIVVGTCALCWGGVYAIVWISHL